MIALRDPTRSVDQAIGSGPRHAAAAPTRAQEASNEAILDAFVVALESLAEHKLRTTLTMLGMMFGVGAVIAMLSIGAGAEKEALARSSGSARATSSCARRHSSPTSSQEIRKKSLGLSLRDVEAIRRRSRA